MPRVLVVEDDALVGEVIADALTGAGHDSKAAANCRAARAAVTDGFIPEVVLLDLRLPDCDGCDLIEDFLKLKPPPAVVLCTGYPNEIERAKMLGARRAILKPVTQERILAEVAEALAERSTYGANP